MAVVPKITLDTNCVINLFDKGSDTATSVSELETIVRSAMSQKADLAVTTRTESDILKDKDEGRRSELLGRLRLLPVVGTVARWDVSKWDDGDVWGDERTDRLTEEVRQIVFPGLTSDSPRFGNKINDVDHLVGHFLNGRDIFVTDDRDILRRRDALKASPGIVVMSPAECASYIDALATRDTQSSPALGTAPEGYRSAAHEGTVTFDYSNNNGSFQIGIGIFAFETKWSKASKTAIHAYSDAPSIDALALVRDPISLSHVSGASSLDFSSRVRSPSVGDVIVWRNIRGLYAATRVVSIKDDFRGDERDELSFEYRILPNGNDDFALT
jgi:hypothetical protein